MTNYAYVYGPVSGSIIARPTGYCSGGSHPTVCTQNPFDIQCASGANIIFTASSNIKSIYTTYTGSGVCLRGSEIPTPWDAKLKVDFYRNLNQQDWVGSVCYAHVANPVPNQGWNVNYKVIGTVPSNCSCACGAGCKCGGYNNLPAERGYCASQTGLCSPTCPCRCCYGGTHVHMEGGITYASLSCNQNIGLGTWVYRWVVPI